MLDTIQLRIIRRPEVLNRLGIGNTALHYRIKEGLIPPPIPLGARAVGWLEHELDQVLKAMAAGKSTGYIKTLVSHLIDQRRNEAA